MPPPPPVCDALAFHSIPAPSPRRAPAAAYLAGRAGRDADASPAAASFWNSLPPLSASALYGLWPASERMKPGCRPGADKTSTSRPYLACFLPGIYAQPPTFKPAPFDITQLKLVACACQSKPSVAVNETF